MPKENDWPELREFDVPKGTTVFAPNDINCVHVMFPTQESAILFFEFFRSLCIYAEKENSS